MLRTPAECFANLPDHPFEPNFAEIPDLEGGTLRTHFVDEGPRDAAQIAKIQGCRVVGVAAGPEQCAQVKEELGADVAVDQKNERVGRAFAAVAPDGADVYFDNVGGEVLNETLMLLNRHARIR